MKRCEKHLTILIAIRFNTRGLGLVVLEEDFDGGRSLVNAKSYRVVIVKVLIDNNIAESCIQIKIFPMYFVLTYYCSEALAPEERVWLIDEQENPIRRRGRTTCADIQNMPPGTRIHIEVNENNIPYNIPESILLGSYLGVVARDPVLAPIAFPDWRNKGMEPFKKNMLDEVETQACNLLAEEGLTPEDENIEANERVFTIVMGLEHSS
ncbi:hypothetical protein IEQ34_000012 [Dendrobium chrysotoxum]|uniref:Uncharacterized protein n=1 Tax=Dendrobium chrysotoxum TaxID=161865 RepID=A0AAV7HPT7_DENCH|nr:hypothetical protein IEQ34_000012 [Dendrobium chrysotoxum]